MAFDYLDSDMIFKFNGFNSLGDKCPFAMILVPMAMLFHHMSFVEVQLTHRLESILFPFRLLKSEITENQIILIV